MTINLKAYNEILENIDKYQVNKAKLIAISKNHPIEAVKSAIIHGVRVFGENRVQEAEGKFLELKENMKNLELHLTGPLQRNKVKNAIKIFDYFHTLDREKIANEFFKYQHLLSNKKFFIQINIGREKTKSGVFPELADEFIGHCKNTLKLNIIGLMCIPPMQENPEPYFKELKNIAEKNNLKELSMGMSSDYKEALVCGSTFVRVGTMLFGKRNYEN